MESKKIYTTSELREKFGYSKATAIVDTDLTHSFEKVGRCGKEFLWASKESPSQKQGTQ